MSAECYGFYCKGRESAASMAGGEYPGEALIEHCPACVEPSDTREAEMHRRRHNACFTAAVQVWAACFSLIAEMKARHVGAAALRAVVKHTEDMIDSSGLLKALRIEAARVAGWERIKSTGALDDLTIPVA